MIRHVVLMKFREGYSKAVLEELVGSINAMPDAIEQIVSLTHGGYAGLQAGKFDYGLVADFASKADLQAYLEHPLHKALGGKMREILLEAASMQFEY